MPPKSACPAHRAWSGCLLLKCHAWSTLDPDFVELLQVATPAVLPLPGPYGLYKRGYGLVLFLNSRGEVTAYHPYGERAWQVRVHGITRSLHAT